MLVKNILDEDFINYKKPSMVIGFPSCNWKCETEYGMGCCQNSTLATSPNIEIPISLILKRYFDNNLTSALVCAGLEAFDSFNDLFELLSSFRERTNSDFVIYTGYYYEEIKDKIEQLRQFENIIIKFGRYIPDQEKHFDEILGVYLASPNQYAEKIS